MRRNVTCIILAILAIASLLIMLSSIQVSAVKKSSHTAIEKPPHTAIEKPSYTATEKPSNTASEKPSYTVTEKPSYTSLGTCSLSCPQDPEAICMLDCLVMTEDGLGEDCEFNFYDINGILIQTCLDLE